MIPFMSSKMNSISLFITFFLIPFVNSVYFKIPRFGPDVTDILYEGDAVASVGEIEFNKFTYLCRVAHAIYKEKVPIWDPDSTKLADFSTHFSFTIDTLNSSLYGHGIAFFLAPVGFQIPPNSDGGFLGLFNTTTSDSAQNQIVVVEFDSFSNPEWDPPFEHVGINKNSIASSETAPWNVSLHSGDPIDAWITYNSTTKNLSVFWNYGKGSNSSISYIINLREVLPSWITIGFSAATGKNVERHTLESWEFSSSLDMEELGGNGRRKIGLIAGLTALGGVLFVSAILALVILRKWRRRKMKRNPETISLTSFNDDLEKGTGPKKFSYEELDTSTNHFSEERKLGEGGFGEVYKGYLIDLDIAIAVKKISRGSKQGKKEYITEVKVISRLRHRNLVQLIGWCHDQGKFLLVYEFMPNGSLDCHLFGKRNPLSWNTRYKISLGLASALLYLHEEWEQCVIHRDIKSSNVMLDSSFNVKLGDFGLARLMDHELGPQTTGLAGTLGYLAPEYIKTGRASKESDVYSFGIVALEIATGRKSVDPGTGKSDAGLVEYVWELYGKGKLLSVVDEKLNLDFDAKQVERLMITGLWCAHPESNLRPSIRQAIHVLNFEASLPNLPVKMPVPVYYLPGSGELGVSLGEPTMTCTSIDVGR
ncbi:L-type lectin-domain containing receptor kinase IX.1-like [Nicotiana sylvestris]|uniref:L-type lectin-domain containing receptor kinase IX.1-like n=1 Tax=Nicotiana sylvestris TaxID=4096 RepID=A0A1U7WDU0_NICSY|nr:PREDICTED: L-type lectin-domain containing receptor kinase IX.1-like [Nicotiana sylvestris]